MVLTAVILRTFFSNLASGVVSSVQSRFHACVQAVFFQSPAAVDQEEWQPKGMWRPYGNFRGGQTSQNTRL